MTNTEKKPPQKRKHCGTETGYTAHMRNKEHACVDCKEARRLGSKARRQAKREGKEPEKRIPKTHKRKEQEKYGAEIAEAVHEAINGGERIENPYPKFLKTAGRDLWDQVLDEYSLNPASLVVLAEACRMADRLDRIAAALASKKVFWFEIGEADNALEDGVPVIVNNMISEARQLAAGMRQALNSIGVLKAAEKKNKGGSITDELQRKREQRLAAAKLVE